jgi:hypothetical protein
MGFLDILTDAPLAFLDGQRLGLPASNVAKCLILDDLPVDVSDPLRILSGRNSVGTVAQQRIYTYLTGLQRSLSRHALLSAGMSPRDAEACITNFESLLNIFFGWEASKTSLIAEALSPLKLNGMSLFPEHGSYPVASLETPRSPTRPDAASRFGR